MNSAHNFLRKMLKSPPYNTTQPSKASELISAALKDSMSKDFNPKTADTANIGSQATVASIGENNYRTKVSSRDCHSNPTSPFKSLANASLSNAQASLASAKYQAHGLSLNFESAGNAYGSTRHHESNRWPHFSPIRVNIPSCHALHRGTTPLSSSSYQDQAIAHAYGASANPRIQVNFGLDGGAESPASKTAEASRSNQDNDPNFDYRGVTTADYEIHRKDHDNSWHMGKVEDFFQDLSEMEHEEILAHRANSKRTV